jgi:hypothetical protein
MSSKEILRNIKFCKVGEGVFEEEGDFVKKRGGC